MVSRAAFECSGFESAGVIGFLEFEKSHEFMSL